MQFEHCFGSHSNQIWGSSLWRSNSKFYWFCRTWSYPDYHILLIGCSNLRCYVDRTKWRNARAMSRLWRNWNWIIVFARCHPVHHNVRSNFICFGFQFFNIWSYATWWYGIGYSINDFDRIVWNVFWWVLETDISLYQFHFFLIDNFYLIFM